jgi:putative FmdB family regulatory protein
VPIYEYQCKKCKHRFEKIHQKFSDARVKKCPECGGPVEQLLSAPAVQFKGSGWYVTDYARKGAPGDSGSSESASSENSGSKAAESSDSKKTESKSESKPETKSESKTTSKTKKEK